MIKKIKLKFVDLFIWFYNRKAMKIIENQDKHELFDRNNDKLVFWVNVKRDLLINR